MQVRMILRLHPRTLFETDHIEPGLERTNAANEPVAPAPTIRTSQVRCAVID